ncbi:MAG: VanZ family protein [Arenimonas sp.]
MNALREFRWPAAWLGIWAFGWLLCVVLSLVHPPQIGIEVPDGDKIGHFLAYGLLAAWAVWIFSAARSHRRAALALCALGVAMELAQGAFTSYRMMDPWDGVADAIGVLAGWALALRCSGLLQAFDRRLSAARQPRS